MPASTYAYLLGFYLGDCTISVNRKGVYRLRIATDSGYPRIIEECVWAMRCVMPMNRVRVQKLPYNAVEIGSSSTLWPLAFPQHGPGRKHTRKIELAPWQVRIVAEKPAAWWFVRGLIHSDGCRAINRVNGGEYPRYFFTQVSTDIRQIFQDACDRLGIEHRRNKWNSISIARRNSVAIMDSIVGPKS